MTALTLMPQRIKKVAQFTKIEGVKSNERNLKSINTFLAPYLQEVCLRKKIVTNDIEFNVLFDELKRYLLLCAKTKQNLAMLNDKIDEIWHQFILFTRYYEVFCKEYLGAFVHHCPNTSFTPTTKGTAIAFVDAYNREYGEIPNEWNIPENYQFMTFENGIRLIGENCGGGDCGGCCDNTGGGDA